MARSAEQVADELIAFLHLAVDDQSFTHSRSQENFETMIISI